MHSAAPVFPIPLDAYPPVSPNGLLATLADRIAYSPFNAIATGIFLLAILHTFAAARFTALAHRLQHRHDEECRARGVPALPSVGAELLHFFGEVEVIFGLWAVVLMCAMWGVGSWESARQYLEDGVNFNEPVFVVVIMALASTRPIVSFAETALSKVAALGGRTPAAWWVVILTIGPLLGSLITEPGAMTICALLLARQFYDRQPSARLKYATLGLLFVNISIGGVLTHFAAPPVLMVARPWGWDLLFMLDHFGWRSVVAVFVSTGVYFGVFRRELLSLGANPVVAEVDRPESIDLPDHAALLPVPGWITATHAAFMAWTVVNAHHPVIFIAGFLFFLGFVKVTAPYQSLVDLKAPLLVGFFLGGLVIHGGMQAWWIAPTLAHLSEHPLYFGATILTAFNDNALITYLATLVPNLSDALKAAVVEGAVTGGGLTVIANAPNPAGQALLGRFFDGAIAPLWLFVAAFPPTLIAIVAFRLL